MSKRVWFDFEGTIDYVRGDHFDYVADIKQAIFRKLGKSVCKNPMDLKIYYIAETVRNNTNNNNQNNDNDYDQQQMMSSLVELRGDTLCRNPETGFDLIVENQQTNASPYHRSTSSPVPNTQLVVMVEKRINNNTQQNESSRPVSPSPGSFSSNQNNTNSNDAAGNYYQQFLRSSGGNSTPPRMAAHPPPQQNQAVSSPPVPTALSSGNPRGSQLFARKTSLSTPEPFDTKIRLGIDIVAQNDIDRVLGTVLVDLPAHLLRPTIRNAEFSPTTNNGARSNSPAQQNRRTDGARIRTILEIVREAVSKNVVVIETPSLPPVILRILAYDVEFGEFVLLTESSNAHITQSFDRETLRPSRAMIAVVDYPTEGDQFSDSSSSRGGFLVTKNTALPSIPRLNNAPTKSPVRSISPNNNNNNQYQSIQEIALRAANPVVVHAPSGSSVPTSATSSRPTTAPATQNNNNNNNANRNQNNNNNDLLLAVSPRPTSSSNAYSTKTANTNAAAVSANPNLYNRSGNNIYNNKNQDHYQQQQQQPQVTTSAQSLADKLENVLQQLQDERQRRSLAERVIAERETSIAEQLAAARKEGADAAREGQNARIAYLNNQFLGTQQELEETRRALLAKQRQEAEAPISSRSGAIEIQRELSELRRARAENESEIDVLKRKRDMLEEHLQLASKSHDDMANEVDGLKVQVTNLVLDRTKLENALDDERRQTHPLKDNVAFDQKVAQLERTLQEARENQERTTNALQTQLAEEIENRRVAEHKSNNINKDLEHYRSTWGKEVTEKTQHIAELQAKLDAMDATKGNEADALLNAKNNADDARRLLEHTRLQVHQLTNQLADERQKNQQLTATVEASTKQLTEQEQQQKAVKASAAHDDETANLFRQKAEQLDKDYAIVCQERDSLKSQLEQTKQVQKEAEEIKARNHETQVQTIKLTRDIAQLQEDVKSEKATSDRLNAENSQLQQRLADQISSVHSSTTTTAPSDAISSATHVSRVEFEKVDSELRKKSAELAKSNESVSTMQADIDRLKEELESANKQLELLQSADDAEQLRSELDHANGKIVTLQTQLSQTHDSLHSQTDVLRDGTPDRVSKLESELLAVRSERDKAQSDSKDYSRQLSEMNESFGSIRQRLQQRIDALNDELRQVRKDNERKLETVKTLEETLEEEKAEHENTRRDLFSQSTRRMSRANSLYNPGGRTPGQSFKGMELYGGDSADALPIGTPMANNGINNNNNNNNNAEWNFNQPASRSQSNVSAAFDQSGSSNGITNNNNNNNNSSSNLNNDQQSFFAAARANIEKDETIARPDVLKEEEIDFKLLETNYKSEHLPLKNKNDLHFTEEELNDDLPDFISAAASPALNLQRKSVATAGSSGFGPPPDDSPETDVPVDEKNASNINNNAKVIAKSVRSNGDDDDDDDDILEELEDEILDKKQPTKAAGGDEDDLTSFGLSPSAADSGVATPNIGPTAPNQQPQQFPLASKVVVASSSSGAAAVVASGNNNNNNLATKSSFAVTNTASKPAATNSSSATGVAISGKPAADAPGKTAAAKDGEESEVDFDLSVDELPTPQNEAHLESTAQPESHPSTVLASKQPPAAPAAPPSPAPKPPAKTSATATKEDSNDSFTFDSTTQLSDGPKQPAAKIPPPPPKPASKKSIPAPPPPSASKNNFKVDADDEESELDFDLTETASEKTAAPVAPTAAVSVGVKNPVVAAAAGKNMANVPAPPRSFQLAGGMNEDDEDDDFSLDSEH